MVTRRSTPRKSARQQPEFVHQFLVVLSGTDPLVWRRIQVPLAYSFWDLHVAIQDAMGWLDYHLHEFRLLDAKDKVASVGIPTDEEPGQRPCVPSWRVRVSDYFNHRRYHALPALYVYDFGDDWEHGLAYEGEEPADAALTYPRCLSGARRCPPEDCGGVHGYVEFLAAISDPAHPEHTSLLTWVGGSYDPDSFDPANVEIEKRLGSTVVLESTNVDAIESLLEQRRGQPIDSVARTGEDHFEQQPEVQEFMQKAAADHWHAWFDEKIPALGNRSPRQAARTANGRERLEALLAHYQWESDRSPNAFAPDVRALRAKLRLPEA